jgi:hypothetical protein
VLVTDASEFAIGARLEQCAASDDVRRPVYERELLGLVIALRTWRHHLRGSEFSVYCKTDHKPLQRC